MVVYVVTKTASHIWSMQNQETTEVVSVFSDEEDAKAYCRTNTKYGSIECDYEEFEVK